jgi:alpha-mannosidase/mannosylglycerate hydrolase
LLQNHAHDSICGCGIDAVHQDMTYRFAQCRQIGRRLTIEATRTVAASVEGAVAPREMRAVVFNPLARALDEIAQVTLAIPSEWATFNEFFGFEPQPAFRIYDPEGRDVAYQRLSQDVRRGRTRLRATRFPERYVTNDVTVALPLRVPALGYTSLTVREEERGGPTRHPQVPALATSERSMCNGILDVVVESNGTLTITELGTAKRYERLLTLEDCADIGDGWYHGVAVNDQIFVSTAASSTVAFVHNGPLQATLLIRTAMQVPERFCFDRMVRSAETTELLVDTLVTLRRGADRVEVQSTVRNTPRDHRLRLLFPSGAGASTYLSDSAFDVVERPISLRADNHLYRELEVETRPQQSWTAVHDQARGLAVVSVGLMECTVRDLPERPIALTLLRGTSRTVMTDGEPDGQVLGDWTFRYWIVPLHGAPDLPRLCLLAQQLAAGVECAQVLPADLPSPRGPSTLPPSASLLSVDGAAVVSSVRQVGGRVEVRLYNPSSRPTAATILLGDLAAQRITCCQMVDLESHPLGIVESVRDRLARVALAPKQIITLSLW